MDGLAVTERLLEQTGDRGNVVAFDIAHASLARCLRHVSPIAPALCRPVA